MSLVTSHSLFHVNLLSIKLCGLLVPKDCTESLKNSFVAEEPREIGVFIHIHSIQEIQLGSWAAFLW